MLPPRPDVSGKKVELELTGLGDMLLGMSAHINRDLPFALAHVGLRKRPHR